MQFHTWIFAALALVLAGCTPTAQAGLGAGAAAALKSAQNLEDIKAQTAIKAPCAITVGAKNRLPVEADRRHVEGLCGGDNDRPITVRDLEELIAK